MTIDLRLIFPLKLRFKKTWKTYSKKHKNPQPTPPPPYILPPLLTAKEIETKRNKANDDFIRTSMQMSKNELDAANEVADQENKELIKGIIDPAPGLFIDDELKPNEQNFKNTTDNVFNRPPQVQQQLDETMFKKIMKKRIIKPTPPEIIPNVVPKTEDFFIDDNEFDSFKKPEPITEILGSQKMINMMI